VLKQNIIDNNKSLSVVSDLPISYIKVIGQTTNDNLTKQLGNIKDDNSILKPVVEEKDIGTIGFSDSIDNQTLQIIGANNDNNSCSIYDSNENNVENFDLIPNGNDNFSIPGNVGSSLGSGNYNVDCTINNEFGLPFSYGNIIKFSKKSASDCEINGNIIPHGKNDILYTTKTVPFGKKCNGIERFCFDGNLDGDKSAIYNSCSVEKAASCTDGTNTYNDGYSFTGYTDNLVYSPNTCDSVTTSCNSGKWTNVSPSNLYNSCSVKAIPDCPSGYNWNPTTEKCEGDPLD